MKDEILLPGIGNVKIRRGVNIRYLSVRMAPGRGVWVNVPFGVSERRVKEFVHTQQEWIKQLFAQYDYTNVVFDNSTEEVDFL